MKGGPAGNWAWSSLNLLKISGVWISNGSLATTRDRRRGVFHRPWPPILLFPCVSIAYKRRVTLGLGGTLRTAPTSGKPVAGSQDELRPARTEAHWNDRHHYDCQPKRWSRKNYYGDQSFGSYCKSRQAHTPHRS